jgi:hypothetical protein
MRMALGSTRAIFVGCAHEATQKGGFAHVQHDLLPLFTIPCLNRKLKVDIKGVNAKDASVVKHDVVEPSLLLTRFRCIL